MPVSPDFLAHISDQLSGFRPMAIRRMFGGAGLFRGGLMFGLVAGDALYFKVGDGNRAAYDAAGAKPFTYPRAGMTASLSSYREVPADVLDDPDTLAEWAGAAWAAARDAARDAPPGPRRRRNGARRGRVSG